MISDSSRVVETAQNLLDALSVGIEDIAIRGRIGSLPTLRLARGQRLRGVDAQASLGFEADGIALTADNRVESLGLVSPPFRRAVQLAVASGERGTLVLANLACQGTIQLIFEDETASSNVSIQAVSVAKADARAQQPRPEAHGVSVLAGALTVWNRSSRSSRINLLMSGVEIGTPDRPVLGTGLLLAGSLEPSGGQVSATAINVGRVYAHSGLSERETAIVAGGVFILHGVKIDRLLCTGSIVTHGANAVPIDNWGSVETWRVMGDAISYGPSAVGFVNVGRLDTLDVRGAIETFGEGARGCAIYSPTGTVRAHTIRTHGDAATGVQVGGQLDRLELTDGIYTEGGTGVGLSKGKMIRSPADAIHIEREGHLKELISTQIQTRSSDALRLRNEGSLGLAKSFRQALDPDAQKEPT